MFEGILIPLQRNLCNFNPQVEVEKKEVEGSIPGLYSLLPNMCMHVRTHGLLV